MNSSHVVRLSDQDAYVIRRALARKDVNGLPMSTGVALLVETLNFASPDVLNKLMNTILGNPALVDQINRFKLDDPPPKTRTDDVHVARLPHYAQLTDKAVQGAEGACAWHNDFVNWARQRSPMTPPLFLEIGGVFLIALAIARRACVKLHAEIYPHIYALWIAETTRHAKSTGLKCIQDVALNAIPHMLMPHQSTPEALLETMAGKLPQNLDDLQPGDRERVKRGRTFAAQRGILLDEASSLLGASKKDYMTGLSEWFLEAYDAPEYKERITRGTGLVVVNRLGISILGATTPAAVARTVTPDKWEDGEMARYLLAYPEEQIPYNDAIGDLDPPEAIVRQLEQLHQALPTPLAADTAVNDRKHTPIYASFMPDAQIAYQNYSKAMVSLMSDDYDARIGGNYGRLPIQAVKIALNFAVMDWFVQGQPESPVINLSHWARAQMLVERTRASIHRLLPVINESADNRAQVRILSVLSQSPSGLTKRDISKRTQIQTRQLESALEVLCESGLIDARMGQNPKGGPKTTTYKIVVTAESP